MLCGSQAAQRRWLRASMGGSPPRPPLTLAEDRAAALFSLSAAKHRAAPAAAAQPTQMHDQAADTAASTGKRRR